MGLNGLGRDRQVAPDVTVGESLAKADKVLAIDFDLDKIATDLSVQFDGGSTAWYGVSHGGCTVTPVGSGTHVHCVISEPLEAVNGLEISAEQFT